MSSTACKAADLRRCCGDRDGDKRWPFNLVEFQLLGASVRREMKGAGQQRSVDKFSTSRDVVSGPLLEEVVSVIDGNKKWNAYLSSIEIASHYLGEEIYCVSVSTVRA